MNTHVGLSSNLVLGAVVGGLGGLGLFASGRRPIDVLLGVGAGTAFVAVAGGRATSPGAGLLWGLACALLAWLAAQVPLLPTFGGSGAGMLVAARDHFSALAASVVLFGCPLGLALGAWNGRTATPRPGVVSFSLARAVVVGGLAGSIGGWAFGKWMEQVNFFPLIAGLLNSTTRVVGVMLHFSIAVAIGGSFGLLFQ